MNNLFGYQMNKCLPIILRRLKYENLNTVTRFQQEYSIFLRSNNIFKKAFRIQQQIEEGCWDNNLQQQYERLRELRYKGIMRADLKCRKLKMGKVP